MPYSSQQERICRAARHCTFLNYNSGDYNKIKWPKYIIRFSVKYGINKFKNYKIKKSTLGNFFYLNLYYSKKKFKYQDKINTYCICVTNSAYVLPP